MIETPTLDLVELERLEKAATEGEWEVRYVLDDPRYGLAGVAVKQTSEDRTLVPISGSGGAMSFTEYVIQEKYTTDPSVANANLIAALRNAAPALIAAAKERDELREERDRTERFRKIHEDHAKRLLFKGMAAQRVFAVEMAAMRAERDEARAELASLRALLVRAGEAFGVIHRRLAPGTLTFDEMIRETGFVDDLARALLAAIARATQTDTKEN